MIVEEIMALLQEHPDAILCVCDVEWQTCGISNVWFDQRYNRLMFDIKEEML